MTTLIRPCISNSRPVVGGTYMFDRGTQHVPRFHQGIDIGISIGTPLYGCGVGRVIGVVRGSTGGGYYVIVRYLANGETVDVITMHMSRIDVVYGQPVTTLTQLGLSGGAAGAVGSGQSTGPHLHLQISVNQALADPDTRLKSRTVVAGGTGTPIIPKPIPTVPEPIPKPKEGKMLIVYGSITGESRKFLIDPFTWTRKEIDVTQASVLGYANIPTIQMVEATMNAIPYAVPAAGIDTAGLVAAVTAAVKPYVNAGDPATIATAVDKALADNFAAIPAEVRAAIIK